jgi:hypothetical protein
MVLNWGENLFIQNGVNVISPFDVTALRRPGSEIREALLPVGMVYANLGLTYNLSSRPSISTTGSARFSTSAAPTGAPRIPMAAAVTTSRCSPASPMRLQVQPAAAAAAAPRAHQPRAGHRGQ